MARLAINPSVPPYRPLLPHHIWKYTHEFRSIIRVCVAPSGLVDTAEATWFTHEAAAEVVVQAISRWRYAPLRERGVRVPFCYSQPIVLKRTD